MGFFELNRLRGWRGKVDVVFLGWGGGMVKRIGGWIFRDIFSLVVGF